MNDAMRGSSPAWIVIVFTVLAFLTIFAAYLTGLKLIVDERVTTDPNSHDGVYFAIHGIALVGAAIGGFAVGKYFRGLGFAFAVLFLAAILVSMMAAQVATFELACAGRNDIIRHWQC